MIGCRQIEETKIGNEKPKKTKKNKKIVNDQPTVLYLETSVLLEALPNSLIPKDLISVKNI